jgi:Glycosyltransferase family 87
MERAGRKAFNLLVFGAIPIAWTAAMFKFDAHLGVLGFDFKGTIWEPGRQILAGHSPYPHPVATEMNTGNPSVYPPLALLLALPFSLLPFGLAYALWCVLLAGATVGTLRILEVRDWRCYTLALGSCPVVFGLVMGNIVVLLLPLAAVIWRTRRRAWWCGLALGLAIAIKLVLWPLLVWLIAARRRGAALVAVGTAAVATLAAWAAVGFAGVRDYPALLHVNTELYGPHSWSLLAGGIGLGLPQSVASALSWLLGLGLLLVAAVLTRHAKRDQAGFSTAILASLVVLPIVWVHSLLILLVPLALASRSVNRQWYIFGGLWLVAFVPRTFAHVGAPPDGVPLAVWRASQSPAPTAQIAAFVLMIGLMLLTSRGIGAQVRGLRPFSAKVSYD